MLVASGASLYIDSLLLLLDAKAVEFENQELVFLVSLSTLAHTVVNMFTVSKYPSSTFTTHLSLPT